MKKILVAMVVILAMSFTLGCVSAPTPVTPATQPAKPAAVTEPYTITIISPSVVVVTANTMQNFNCSMALAQGLAEVDRKYKIIDVKTMEGAIYWSQYASGTITQSFVIRVESK